MITGTNQVVNVVIRPLNIIVFTTTECNIENAVRKILHSLVSLNVDIFAYMLYHIIIDFNFNLLIDFNY